MVIRLRDELQGRHCHTRVFVGKDEDHLALSGRLCMEIDEWALFGAMLLCGVRQTNGRVIVQLPDSEAMGVAIGEFEKKTLERHDER